MTETIQEQEAIHTYGISPKDYERLARELIESALNGCKFSVDASAESGEMKIFINGEWVGLCDLAYLRGWK